MRLLSLAPRNRVFFDLFNISALATQVDDTVDFIAETADFMGL